MAQGPKPKPTLKPKPKDRYHHGNLRHELVTGAVAIIERDGVDALTLRSVAKRLRVSQTAPYRHFESKELLLAAVAADGFGSLLLAIEERLARLPPDPVARFLEVGAAYFDFARSHPAHFRVMYGPRPSEFGTGPVADAGRTAFRRFVEIIVECQRAGRADTGDPTSIAVGAWGYVYGVTCLYLDGLLPRRFDDAAVVALIRDMRGFLRRPPAASDPGSEGRVPNPG
ncbi:MAG TPA: TetR/AcrR family transcriptional regulator [Polyangiaceae bacterium]